jgi:hypothetical protein
MLQPPYGTSVYLRGPRKRSKLAARCPYAATWSVYSATYVEKASMSMQGNELLRKTAFVDSGTQLATRSLAHDVEKKCTTPVPRVAINRHGGCAQIVQWGEFARRK